MDYLSFLGAFFLSLLLGMLLVPKILLISYKKRLFDQPDSRKVHTMPIPRLGGYLLLPGDTDYLVLYPRVAVLYRLSDR